MFHPDEYVGISEDHPASFCKYPRKWMIDIDKVHPGKVYLIQGDVPDPQE